MTRHDNNMLLSCLPIGYLLIHLVVGTVLAAAVAVIVSSMLVTGHLPQEPLKLYMRLLP